MPELPEVEVTKRGIEPHVLGKKVTGVTIYDGRLRWPVPKNLEKILKGFSHFKARQILTF
jgi:formamidopyrimidine-DNA glycosylase